VEQVVAGIAPHGSTARIEALGATVIRAEARFLDRNTVAAGDFQIRARRFILATGARSVVPGIPGLDSVPFFTSETIFDNTRKLTHLVVIGGGATGLEVAQSYARLGSEVTVIASAAPLPVSDPELVSVALERMRTEGVEIRENTEVTTIQPRSQGIGVLVRSNERDELLDASHILVADGRVPNLEGLDLEKAGIVRSKSDPLRLEVSAGLRTTNRRVYAIGAAAAGEPRAHLAAYHARLAVRGALLGLPTRAETTQIPAVAFTDPEIAEVGLAEPEARRRLGEGFRVLRASFADNDRAKATRQAYGVIKLVVGRNGRILGAGIVGDRAGELITLFSLAISRKLTMRDLAESPVPHATLAESIGQLAADYFHDSPTDALVERMVALVRLLP
jgi:pyruvate/2-oxoglutarate dehydrogenase complex dihydrolipoamide dehydrogenase (E3) component